MKLVEVETEVASLMATHFPDDDTALHELRELVQAFKDADDSTESRDDISEKDVLLDAMIEWGQRQRSKRLRAYRGTSQFDEQKAVADDIQAKAQDMVRDAVDRRKRIDDLLGEWRKDIKPRLSASTQEEYERAIGRFLKWCQKHRIIAFEQVNRQTVRSFVADTYHGKMGRTVKLALGALNGVWEHARTIGWMEEKSRVWMDHNYPANVRIGTGEKKGGDEQEKAFSFDDIRALLPGVKPKPFADVYRLGLITGARSSEITSLRPEHVSRDDGGFWLRLHGTKTDSARRSVPVPRAFNPLMERLQKEADEYLIPLFPGRKWESERDRNRYINKELNRKRRDVGLPYQDHQGVHSTRRTYTEMMEGAGVPVDTIKLLVGHKRTDITFGRYSKGTLVDLRASVEMIEYPEDIVRIINE
jgi:integrase